MKRSQSFIYLAVVLWSLLFFSKAGLAEIFQSKPSQVSLVELYTSEGCSSCPPADAWLSRLRQDSGLWKDFVPVGFHVHYWDYLGWKDRLGSKEFADRQRNYALSGGLSSVYTPGLILNGREWRQWRSSRSVPNVKDNVVGILKVESEDSGTYHLTFMPKPYLSGSWTGSIALLGFDVSSNVKAGENSGKKLKHDFAVLDFKQDSLKNEDGIFKAVFSLNVEIQEGAHLGIAAWVQQGDSMVPVQATGGYL